MSVLALRRVKITSTASPRWPSEGGISRLVRSSACRTSTQERRKLYREGKVNQPGGISELAVYACCTIVYSPPVQCSFAHHRGIWCACSAVPRSIREVACWHHVVILPWPYSYYHHVGCTAQQEMYCVCDWFRL